VQTHLKHKHVVPGPDERSTLSLQKIVAYASISIGAIVIACLLIFLFVPATFVNGYLKKQIIKTFTKASPAYSIRIAGVHYSLGKNRVACDSIALTSKDSAFSCSVGKVSVEGIAWLQILLHGDSASKVLNSSVMEAREITLIFRRSQYQLRCGRLRVSMPDSGIMTEAIELHPVVNDGKFFSSSKFRRTRLRIAFPQCKVTGADCLGLLQGKTYRARSVKINNPSFDVLVDMDTPCNKSSSSPLMPNEGLSAIHKITQVNSLNIINGRLKYMERYIVGSPPAEVTFDSMRLSAEGIANHAAPGATAVIQGQGTFMKTSTMKIRMVVPVVSPEIPIRYSGSLDGMDLTRLNSFLEIGERLRIKSGVLETATFDITIIAGRASGTLRAMYKDLNIAVLGKVTGSENGAVNRISTFITNTMKIRGNNMPDKSGQIKIGAVKYTRKQEDTFLQLVWFSIRSGIGDVVGF
jgi:hypothetical protein